MLALDSELAAFGTVPYGHTIVGRLELSKPFDACEDVRVTTTKQEQDIPFILLAKRGNCHFARKAQNAAKLGASALIVIDNVQEDLTKILPFAEQDVAAKIHIPTLLVREDEFRPITTAVQNHSSDVNLNNDIMLSLTFPIEKRETTTFEILLDISDKRNLETLADIKDYLYPLIKAGKVAVINNFNLKVFAGSPTSATRPYNCVKVASHTICAKSSGKN